MHKTRFLWSLALATMALPLLALPAAADTLLHQDLGVVAVDAGTDQYGAVCAGEATRVLVNGYAAVCAGKGILRPGQPLDCWLYIDFGYTGFKRCL